MEERKCSNCAFVERDIHERYKTVKLFCTNLDVNKCFEFVSDSDSCSAWVKHTETTKYYNRKM